MDQSPWQPGGESRRDREGLTAEQIGIFADAVSLLVGQNPDSGLSPTMPDGTVVEVGINAAVDPDDPSYEIHFCMPAGRDEPSGRLRLLRRTFYVTRSGGFGSMLSTEHVPGAEPQLEVQKGQGLELELGALMGWKWLPAEHNAPSYEEYDATEQGLEARWAAFVDRPDYIELPVLPAEFTAAVTEAQAAFNPENNPGSA